MKAHCSIAVELSLLCGLLSSHTGWQPVYAPSGGRSGARQRFAACTFLRRRSEVVPARCASGFGPELPIQCSASSTTFGFLLNRRPGLPWAASDRPVGRPTGLGARAAPITSVKKGDSWRCPAVRRAAIGSPFPSVTRVDQRWRTLPAGPTGPCPRAGSIPSSSRLDLSLFYHRSVPRPPSGWPGSLCCVHPTAPSRYGPQYRAHLAVSRQSTEAFRLRPIFGTGRGPPSTTHTALVGLSRGPRSEEPRRSRP